MEKNDSKLEKHSYTIGEVAEMFSVNTSLLRFWEQKFNIINPRKSKGGTRYYQKEDIENIRLIYFLVKEKGMKLEGALKQLRDNKERVIRTHEIITRLKDIKTEIIGLRNELD